MDKKANYFTIIKIFLVVIFLPAVLIWYVWKKTDWKEDKKVIATSLIVFFSLLLFFISSGAQNSASTSNVAKTEPVKTTVPKVENKAPKVELVQEEKSAQENAEIIKVKRAIDGDTIELENGKTLRYIGIDTPETVHPSKPIQCFGKEASAKNKELVEGKEVKLVKDVSETDKYGRILRYVYVGDIFVNDYLVRNGFAYSSSYPPDIRFQDQFQEAEKQARENSKGLWGDLCNGDTAQPAENKNKNTTVVPITKPISSGSTYSCNCSKTCTQMDCAEAQYQLNTCGCSRRDADKDGVACNAQCK